LNQKKVKKIRRLVRSVLAEGKTPFQAFSAVKEQMGQTIRRKGDAVKADNQCD